MSTKNLSEFDKTTIPSAKNMNFGIIAAEWNPEITDSLKDGAKKTLINLGAEEKNIIVKRVPGTFELSLAGQWMAEYTDVDAIILLGCVIQGETRHFDFICQSVTKGTTELGMKYNKPFIFGIVTAQNQQQAIDRSGGKLGNKGDEAAVAAIKMVALKEEMKEKR